MERDDEPKVETEPSSPAPSAPTDLFATDDRLIVLERESATHARHLSQLEGALFNQMLTLSVLEVFFALLLAGVLFVEYRRRSESEGAHGTD